jgi:hypothetical protein
MTTTQKNNSLTADERLNQLGIFEKPGHGKIFVTVEIAQAMLSRNTRYKQAISQSVVDSYIQRLKSKLFWDGNSVKFDSDGFLMDGRHRLTAIVQSGIAADMVVETGIVVRAYPKRPHYWLDPISPALRWMAIKALDEKDPGFLGFTDNLDGMELVSRNQKYLLEAGIYEACLVWAFTGTRLNWSGHDDLLLYLFSLADCKKLLAQGDALPDREVFTLYRGISGRGQDRGKVKGWSWTSSLKTGWWFARRFEELGLEDPAVYQAEVHRGDILFFTNAREESEFVCLPTSLKPKKVKPRRRSRRIRN